MTLLGSESGMTAIEYIGTNAGDMVWHGEVTRTKYILGGVNRRQYVDKRDAGERPTKRSDGSGFLALRRNGKYLFEKYTPPKPETISLVKEKAFD
jgi:hypothetical protein